MVGGLAGGSKTVGDIVIAPFPYTDFTAFVYRPVLVVARASARDWVVCQITSRRQASPRNIAITQDDLQAGVLERNSWVRPSQLHTIEENLLSPAVGQLTEAKQAEITAAVRSLF